jgi:hypothetical protein
MKGIRIRVPRKIAEAVRDLGSRFIRASLMCDGCEKVLMIKTKAAWFTSDAKSLPPGWTHVGAEDFCEVCSLGRAGPAAHA